MLLDSVMMVCGISSLLWYDYAMCMVIYIMLFCLCALFDIKYCFIGSECLVFYFSQCQK